MAEPTKESAPPQSAPPPTPIDKGALAKQIQELTGVPPEEAMAMMDAIERGEQMYEFYGLTDKTLNSYENLAVALYKQHQYEQAEQIFVLLTRITKGQHESHWRGAAACRQGQLDYQGAIALYCNALLVNPNDGLSSVYLAECLLTVGQIDNAKLLLRDICERSGEAKEDEMAHIKRARAILQNIDQEASHRALKRQQMTPASPEATASEAKQTAAADHPFGDDFVPFEPDDVVPEPESDDPEIQAFMNQPGVREKLEILSNLVERNSVTIREIADFSPEQMDAGYAVCCSLLEQRNYPKALEVCGWMLHIDAQDSRFYQLAGLCAFNLSLYCLAEHMFNMDTIWRKTGPDAATLVYKGEALLRQNEVADGLKAIAEGIELAGAKREYQQIVKRAKTLQQVYGMPAA